MKILLVALSLGLMVAAAHAKLPAPPPLTDAQKAEKAQKEAADKAKDAADLGKAQDKAVANYKKNKGTDDAKK